MKILFINPSREHEIVGNNPSIIDEERGVNPPLGILYIAAYLRAHSNHEITIIDAQVEKLSYKALEERIASRHPDIVGLTAMTMTLIDVIKVIGIVKAIDPSIRVVLGGPHVNLFPEETILLPGVDFLVLGEGEKAFKDLVDSIDDQSMLKTVPGIVFRQNKQVVNTEKRPYIGDLNALPFPARDMVPYKNYRSLLTKGEIVTTIFTSRGCPFKCSFCDRPHLGKSFRSRSAKNVVDELEECVKMGISDFLFYDDTFTVVKRRTIEICKEIIRRDLKIVWDIRARVDTVDEEVLDHLKKAGCAGIHYGVEAGTQKILKILNKGITINQVERIFTLTRQKGIDILAYFMIGNPGETRDDILETFRMMKLLNPDFVHLTIFTPFPGTKLYNDGLGSGIIKSDYWKVFSNRPTVGFIPPHWDENFSRQELNELLVKGYKSFYLRPSYILKRIIKLRSFKEFKKKAIAGIKVMIMK